MSFLVTGGCVLGICVLLIGDNFICSCPSKFKSWDDPFMFLLSQQP
uniref:Uncharacterized protein n=1 Tax=Rhizophora mucronata TaxID=61149 RepID=A0A2P2QUH0_RHIMU